jgi:Holliday junction resolvasome RuvABC ATP-dependent DNA helicase subunit
MAKSSDESKDRTLSADRATDDREYDITLRPSRFDEFIGQRKLKDNLRVYVEAARRRKGPLDHVLFCGPPGLGKTTLSLILAKEMGVNLAMASGPAIEHKGQLAALLTKLERGDVLFIDEIHRLSPIVEENLYTAVEDFRIDIVQGDGPYAATLQLPSGSTTTRPTSSPKSCSAAHGCYRSRSSRARLPRSHGEVVALRASSIGCCGARATSPKC